MKFKLGVIGMGVMATAILEKAVQNDVLKAHEVCVYDIDAAKLKGFAIGMVTAESLQALVSASDCVLLAVKPQHYAEICATTVFPADITLVSIMAGVKIATLRAKTNSKMGIVRVMPNTPCRIGKGLSVLAFDGVSQENHTFITALFSACGDTMELSEDKFDAVTSVSGSGPAYVYLFADAMIQGGMQGGLTYEESKHLTLSTLIGASALMGATDVELTTLIEQVCSKGGTTIEAVSHFRQKHLTDIVMEGMEACRMKSELLSEKL